MPAKLLTVAGVADLLSVSKSYVYKMTERGEIPCIHIGAAIRYSIDNVNTYIAKCATVANRSK